MAPFPLMFPLAHPTTGDHVSRGWAASTALWVLPWTSSIAWTSTLVWSSRTILGSVSDHLNTILSPPLMARFLLLATFRRFLFRLTEESVALALQSCLGGRASDFSCSIPKQQPLLFLGFLQRSWVASLQTSLHDYFLLWYLLGRKKSMLGKLNKKKNGLAFFLRETKDSSRSRKTLRSEFALKKKLFNPRRNSVPLFVWHLVHSPRKWILPISPNNLPTMYLAQDAHPNVIFMARFIPMITVLPTIIIPQNFRINPEGEFFKLGSEPTDFLPLLFQFGS